MTGAAILGFARHEDAAGAPAGELKPRLLGAAPAAYQGMLARQKLRHQERYPTLESVEGDGA